MNIIDVIIVLFILSGAVIGFKNGFTRQLVSALGFFIVVILAFLLKNPVSIFLYEHLPFFDFYGIIKGVTVLNIALYEILALFIVMSLFMIIFKIVIFATKIFEKALTLTIFLGIPSKIGGAIIGIIQNYVWAFIILYILTLPVLNIDLSSSKYKNKILDKTLLLSDYISDSVKVIDEFALLKDKYEKTPNAREFNRETLDLFLKYKVVTVDSIETLVKNDKLKINNIKEVLNKYKED